MATPSIDPPLAPSSDARLLVHQGVLSSVIRGLHASRPWLFIYGSFDIPKYGTKKNPIELPAPNGGAVILLNYRIELAELEVDLAPSDLSVGGFANPFALASEEVAIYATVFLDVAGEPSTLWRDRVTVRAWIRCDLPPIHQGIITFRLTDVRVEIDGMNNHPLANILNHIFHDYFGTIIPKFEFPIGNLLQSDMFKAELVSLHIDLNAADAKANLK